MWSFLRGWFSGRSTAPVAGAAGENAAADFLVRRGFRIVARNWRNPADEREEIDLVCQEGDVVVFVEVKARAANAMVPGYFAVNKKKKQILRRAALAYLRGLRLKPATFRLDVVEVAETPGQPSKLLHFENVPLFAKHDRP
ncbi:MAG TPA: YraN family protein [Opitutaceae bacterium]